MSAKQVLLTSLFSIEWHYSGSIDGYFWNVGASQGHAYWLFGNEWYEGIIVKIDSLGNKIWEKFLGSIFFFEGNGQRNRGKFCKN